MRLPAEDGQRRERRALEEEAEGEEDGAVADAGEDGHQQVGAEVAEARAVEEELRDRGAVVRQRRRGRSEATVAAPKSTSDDDQPGQVLGRRPAARAARATGSSSAGCGPAPRGGSGCRRPATQPKKITSRRMKAW